MIGKANFDPPIEINDGQISSALLDFDLSRSFILKGNPYTFIGGDSSGRSKGNGPETASINIPVRLKGLY